MYTSRPATAAATGPRSLRAARRHGVVAASSGRCRRPARRLLERAQRTRNRPGTRAAGRQADRADVRRPEPRQDRSPQLEARPSRFRAEVGEPFSQQPEPGPVGWRSRHGPADEEVADRAKLKHQQRSWLSRRLPPRGILPSAWAASHRHRQPPSPRSTPRGLPDRTHAPPITVSAAAPQPADDSSQPTARPVDQPPIRDLAAGGRTLRQPRHDRSGLVNVHRRVYTGNREEGARTRFRSKAGDSKAASGRARTAGFGWRAPRSGPRHRRGSREGRGSHARGRRRVSGERKGLSRRRSSWRRTGGARSAPPTIRGWWPSCCAASAFARGFPSARSRSGSVEVAERLRAVRDWPSRSAASTPWVSYLLRSIPSSRPSSEWPDGVHDDPIASLSGARDRRRRGRGSPASRGRASTPRSASASRRSGRGRA